MKKKILGILLISTMTSLFFAGCGEAAEEKEEVKSDDVEVVETSDEELIAMITDSGDIDDQSFNQIIWETISTYCDANEVGYQYYKPTEDSIEQRTNAVELAIEEGATVVVTPGSTFGSIIAEFQSEYEDVCFIGIDVDEKDLVKSGDNVPVGDNVYLCSFREEQAGFLAGYGLVKDGYKELGFLGRVKESSSQRYGYGFIQGINEATKESDVNVNVNYYYAGKYVGDDEVLDMMESWYEGGTEVVFSCGEGLYTSVLDAAFECNGKMVGVDIDQHALGEVYSDNPIVTSAMKGLNETLNFALNKYFNGEWNEIGGKSQQFGLENGDYVGLPTNEDSWEFENFSLEDYENVKTAIKDKEIIVSNEIDKELKTEDNVKVNYLN